MNFKRKTALRLEIAALPLALASLVPSAAWAQDATNDAAANCLDENDNGVCDADESSMIVVTGSRIERPELTNLEPTVSVTDQYLKDTNTTNIADALNNNPVFKGSVTPAGTQSSYGNGVNFVNTFGIGSNRTLTLVNGRRVVSSNVPSLFGPGSPGTQVDLNIIPTIMVDRVDEVAIGGAPVYGSDAIAGTINVILKKRYDGVTLSAKSGITDRGDGHNYNFSGLFGKNFGGGRGNFTVAASYDNQKGIRGIQRKHITDNIGSLNNCTTPGGAPNPLQLNPNIGCNTSTTDGIPARILYRNLHSPYLSSGGVVLDYDTFNFTGLQFDNSGRLVPVESVSRLTGFFGAGGNTYQTSDQTQVTSDLRRLSVYATADYEITDGMTMFGEALYYDAKAQELGTSPSFNTFVFDPDVSGGLDFDVATSPFINPADKTKLINMGVSRINLSRSNEDLFDQSASSTTELKRGVLGLRGDFETMNRNFNWEVSVTYGENKVTNYNKAINQQRFINAVSVAAGPGNTAVCTTTPVLPVAEFQPVQPIADPACRPLNLFGFGQASPEALAYIAQDVYDIGKLRQWVVNANIGGSLFNLWAGDVLFNIGYEHRDEKAAFIPDPFSIAGLGRNSAITPTSGQYNLDEGFGEVLVPLISEDNNFFIKSAEMFGRVRYVHSTVNGGFTSWAAGGKIVPISGVTLRGNFTRSFRAPAITELYLPISPTFERPSDLCTAAARNAGPAAATRAANCGAFLTAVGANPATYVLLASQASVAGLSGGNPNLKNEQADSYTFGGVLQPAFIPGLDIAVDYVNIKIKGPIASLTAANLASGCFDNPNFNTSDPRNGNQFCTALGFGADGQIPNSPTNPAVRTGYINGQQYKFSGIVGSLNYVTSLSGIGIDGKMRFGLNAMWVENRINDITGVAPTRSDGLLGDPKLSAQMRVGYEGKQWGITSYVNFVGKQLTSVSNRGPNPNDTREFDHYKPFATADLSLFFKTEDNFRFTVAVANLFDRIGQEYYGYIVPASVNDDIGRRFSVSVTKAF